MSFFMIQLKLIIIRHITFKKGLYVLGHYDVLNSLVLHKIITARILINTTTMIKYIKFRNS